MTLSVEESVPIILDRRRIDLIGPGLPSAPYHHEGLALPLDEAEPLILKSRDSVREHCRSALAHLRSSFGVDAVAIQESPYDALPESVPRVLASKPLTYAADGMLYREALASQAARIGLAVDRFPRKSDTIAAASRALRCSVPAVTAILDGFGKSVGAPWRKEHKHVAAALSMLAAGTDLRKGRGRRTARGSRALRPATAPPPPGARSFRSPGP